MTLEDRVRALAAEYRKTEARARETHDKLFTDGLHPDSYPSYVIAGWHARFATDLERILTEETTQPPAAPAAETGTG